ncbi:sporulation protein YqfD [Clostridioides difficile]|nr:sporulation protein YqfD [Clostridioides difficile]
MISFIRGYYVIVVEGVRLEQFLNHLIRNGISVYNVTRIKNTKMEFHIDRQDIKEFKNVYRGSKFDIKVKQKLGSLLLSKEFISTKVCGFVLLFLYFY